MGLVKATVGAIGGNLADQWEDFFCCDALDDETIMLKGKKKSSRRSSNIHGNSNVISNGSVIIVADGQCALIVDQGVIVEVCAEPGEYIYDSSTESSIFAGTLDCRSINEFFASVGKRFIFGGDAPKDQRLYYINTKELLNNPYGTPAPVPFRIVDRNVGFDIDVSIRCFGNYSYKITNPLLFYTNVCGNCENGFKRSQIDDQLKSELLTALHPAFADISAKGIRYSELPGHTIHLMESLNRILSGKWKKLRGIEIVSIGISSIRTSEHDEEMIKELQRNAVFTDPTMAAAQLVGAQATAMKDAAKNESAGAALAFMGVNMASQVEGINTQQLYEIGVNIAPTVEKAQRWICSCGRANYDLFCSSCGNRKPKEKKIVCSECGTEMDGTSDSIKFCPHCGNKLM